MSAASSLQRISQIFANVLSLNASLSFRAHIPRDGNCLFRAFAEAMYHDQGQQEKLRNEAVQAVVRHWDNYKVGIEEVCVSCGDTSVSELVFR